VKRIYHTHQRKLLLDFLQSHPDGQYTVEEIVAAMRSDDMPGRSTVYRIMQHLVEEGLVRRFVKDNSRRFLYQYLNPETCSAHLHLKCVSCGRLEHLEDAFSRRLEQTILKSHDFSVDESATLLMGTCRDCRVHQNTGEAVPAAHHSCSHCSGKEPEHL